MFLCLDFGYVFDRFISIVLDTVGYRLKGIFCRDPGHGFSCSCNFGNDITGRGLGTDVLRCGDLFCDVFRFSNSFCDIVITGILRTGYFVFKIVHD